MSQENQSNNSLEAVHGTFRSALIGFGISIVLTFLAYTLVSGGILQGNILNWTLLMLGLIQMWAQLHYFLHLGEETKPQWNLLAFIFMILVVFILVIGTLWIMSNLEYRDMRMNLQHQNS